MTTFNVLYSADQITYKVLECAEYIDNIGEHNTVLCPIMQSSFMFASDVAKQLHSRVSMDFCGVNRYADDGTEDSLFLYKGVDPKIIDNKVVVVLDTLCSTGTTMDFAARLLKQMGAIRVYTVCLLTRQFSAHKPNWKGFTISDETVYGYGLDQNQKYRTLPFIAYE
jgi:hypoxanthine phosphoribosyltransferase